MPSILILPVVQVPQDRVSEAVDAIVHMQPLPAAAETAAARRQHPGAGGRAASDSALVGVMLEQQQQQEQEEEEEKSPVDYFSALDSRPASMELLVEGEAALPPHMHQKDEWQASASEPEPTAMSSVATLVSPDRLGGPADYQTRGPRVRGGSAPPPAAVGGTAGPAPVSSEQQWALAVQEDAVRAANEASAAAAATVTAAASSLKQGCRQSGQQVQEPWPHTQRGLPFTARSPGHRTDLEALPSIGSTVSAAAAGPQVLHTIGAWPPSAVLTPRRPLTDPAQPAGSRAWGTNSLLGSTPATRRQPSLVLHASPDSGIVSPTPVPVSCDAPSPMPSCSFGSGGRQGKKEGTFCQHDEGRPLLQAFYGVPASSRLPSDEAAALLRQRLLPEHDEEEGAAAAALGAEPQAIGWWAATALLANALLGAGILAAPRALSLLGLIAWCCTVVGVAALVLLSQHLLLCFGDADSGSPGAAVTCTYGAAVHASLGGLGGSLADAVVAAGAFGQALLLLVAVADVLVGNSTPGLLSGWAADRSIALWVMAAVVFAPLLSFGSMRTAAGTSFAAVAAAGIWAGTTAALAIAAAVTHQASRLPAWPVPPSDGPGPAWLRRASAMGGSIAVVLMALVGSHVCTHPVLGYLRHPSPPRTRAAVATALGIGVALVLPVGLCSYALFGSDMPANVLLSFQPAVLEQLTGASIRCARVMLHSAGPFGLCSAAPPPLPQPHPSPKRPSSHHTIAALPACSCAWPSWLWQWPQSHSSWRPAGKAAGCCCPSAAALHPSLISRMYRAAPCRDAVWSLVFWQGLEPSVGYYIVTIGLLAAAVAAALSLHAGIWLPLQALGCTAGAALALLLPGVVGAAQGGWRRALGCLLLVVGLAICSLGLLDLLGSA